jgi:hypothetical protein
VSEETVVVGNPNVPSYHFKVNATKYRAMKDVLFKVFPSKGPGMTQNEMMKAVEGKALREVFPGKTYAWWPSAPNSTWNPRKS